MALRSHTAQSRPGDILVVIHEFLARSSDELTLRVRDRIELTERDDDFGDGWFLGRNIETNQSGLFPETYTRPSPTPANTNPPPHPRSPALQHNTTPPIAPGTATSTPDIETPLSAASAPTEPLNLQPDAVRRASLNQTQRSSSGALPGDGATEPEPIGSPVMHETLTVIDEHITDMSTPRHSSVSRDLKPVATNDSGSEYSSHHRLSYIHGHETDDEEQSYYTEEEVNTWSPARVAEYLEDVGVEKKHCAVFRDQEIDGEALLGVDRNFIFMKEFDLGPMGPRLRTWMKINALQQEVRANTDAARATTPLDTNEDFTPDTSRFTRDRASSASAVLPRIPTLRESMGARGSPGRQSQGQNIPRAMSSAGRSTTSTVEPTSPLIQTIPPSPGYGSSTRPSAASIRSFNHNRRHSSIDYNANSPGPGSVKPSAAAPTALPSHRKAPSFDRNWTMGSPQKHSPEPQRPASSNHAHATSMAGGAFNSRDGAFSPALDLDKGYFSGGEVETRKNRNLLRKKDSPTHSRNPSFIADLNRHTSFSRRHSRLGSADSAATSQRPISSAAKQYYGGSATGDRSSSALDFVRPLKPMNEMSPTVTKLTYDSHSIDAIANSPAIPGSETSSTGRVSPTPAAPAPSHSFFGKKSRSTGLRAISDAITGGERANASAVDVATTPNKDSPMQSPTRTGSSTSISKSFELEKNDRRNTTSTTTTKEGGRKKKHGTSAYLKGRQQISPQEAMQNCDYSGWMKKKSSSLMTTWKTRLFVLRGRRLSYYYTENDTEEKGLIDISSHRVLPANNERMTGLHAAITRASSSPSSPQNATIQTAASAAVTVSGMEDDMAGMFIFKLVPPRAGLQKGVQFTKPIVHYFAVDSLAIGRLWMAALMKATIDRDEGLPFTTTYQQKTISLEKARAMRQRPPNLMDTADADSGSGDMERRSDQEKQSIRESVIHEEDEKQGLAISGLDDARALLQFTENNASIIDTPDSDSKLEHKQDNPVPAPVVS